MPRKPRVPKYRKHSSGQARVTLDGKDYLLGQFDSTESHSEYKRLTADWLDKKGVFSPDHIEQPYSLNELILAFWEHAVEYYGWNRNYRGDEYCYRDALRIVRKLYGDTPAVDFGPKRLKACRDAMLPKEWSRNYINAQVKRIANMYRWGAEEELVPGAIHDQLKKVRPLEKGRTKARETKPVKPVDVELVEATLPFMPPTVAAMVRFELWTGCRPEEVCGLRRCDIDMSNPACWIYQPEKHKTQRHGHQRLILVGPNGQEVLRPYLIAVPEDQCCFSPEVSERKRNQARTEQRRSPVSPTAKKRKRKPNRTRQPGDRYDTYSYRRAIYRACDKAFPPPAPLAQVDGETKAQWQARLTEEQQEQLAKWQKDHRWHPNQLRHNRATELRKHGLDVTSTVLGHSKIETSQIYAEKDLKSAMELIEKIG